jgi:phage recombination protein Bet
LEINMAGEVVAINGNTALTAMTENELVDVLQSSLYPGAALKSIKMVIGYCKAANLDPMQKPVHIVPMWDKNAKQMRDVIMPGVGLYRTQAARSNALAGISEPEFGPVVEFDLDGKKFKAPEWARVVVDRLLPNGAIGKFSAVEYWIENYATSGKDSESPNAMWKKRPRGQLGKCAQAQALRTAFPEMTGSAPTADEMEGKTYEAAEVDITPKPDAKPEIPECTADVFSENKLKWRKTVEDGKKTAESLLAMLNTRATFSDAQRAEIMSWKKVIAEVAEQTPAASASFDAGLDGDYVPE